MKTDFKSQIANFKSSLIATITLGALVSGCACPPAAPAALQPKGLPSSGQWHLDREEFERGELAGLVVGDGAPLGNGLRLADGALQGTFTSRAFDSGGAFDALTFSMDLDASDTSQCTLQARTSLEGSSWTPWLLLEPDESDDAKDGDQASYGQIVPVTSGRYAQFRLILERNIAAQQAGGGGGASPTLRGILVDYVYAADGPDVYQAKAAALPAQPEPGAPRPVIIPRAGWGAQEQRMTWKPTYRHPARIIIHHTVTPNHEDNPAATVRAIYYFHAITRKWGDIGYNYLIDWHGNIYEGRAGGEKVVGGHARGYNEGSVGVALMGTYTRDDISPAMHDSLVALLAWLSARYGIDPQGQATVYGRRLPNIMGHRAVAKTTCPGDPVLAQLDALRAQVAAVVERHGGIAAVTATPLPTRAQPRATSTPTATPRVTGTPRATPTATPLALAQLTETTQPTLSPSATSQPETTATPQPEIRKPEIIITGLEVWPYPPAANRPVTLAVHLVNVGPADLAQVSVQVMIDVEQAEGGQMGLAWQLDRLRAGQELRLDLSTHDRLAISAGRHRLSVRAAGRDESGQVIASEWGPLAVSVEAGSGETPPAEGWRMVVQRWGLGLSQAWETVQKVVNSAGP
ncbi:MAG: N-acetylmuramoyl-L-alanine amidase [Thermoflexales bacterium]|nr:N-acetylmuramoyl-L-alanine amidase [Thermoflexales bacterium]